MGGRQKRESETEKYDVDLQVTNRMDMTSAIWSLKRTHLDPDRARLAKAPERN